MSIRKIEFTVTENGISPATEQSVGMQGEHAATELKFAFSNDLFKKLQNECGDDDSLVYRFDTCDSIGNTVPYDSAPLTNNSVSFIVGENLSRNGGKATVNLVVTRYDALSKTELELISRPARLVFENVPKKGKSNGYSVESLSTIAESAKKAAEEALLAKDKAIEAKEITESAKLSLEGGSVIFDGGGPETEIPVELVIDDEVNDYSDNPVSGRAVANEIKKILLQIYPIGSIYLSFNNINPHNLFGGTWERIEDRFLLAAGNKYSVGSTGGEAEHKLTVAEMPSHSHNSFISTENGKYFGVLEGSGGWLGQVLVGWGNKVKENVLFSAGGSQPHNNMPPYVSVYMWKRVS